MAYQTHTPTEQQSIQIMADAVEASRQLARACAVGDTRKTPNEQGVYRTASRYEHG